MKAIVNFLLWLIIIFIGLKLNRNFLINNNFTDWEYSYLFYSFVVSFLMFLSYRYYLVFVLFNLLFQLFICISELFSVDFSQEGLEIIEYSCNLMFPHSELVFHFILDIMIVYLKIKWAIFWSCIGVIISANCLIFIIKALSSRISKFILLKIRIV